MSSKSEIILEVCAILAQQADLKVTVKESAKGAAIVSVGTFFGALLAGRKGLLAGAALGSAAAVALGSEFRSAVDVIKNDMDKSQREQLIRAINSLLDGVNVANTGTVMRALSANCGLKSKVVNEISNFLKYKMQMNVCKYS